MATQAAFVDFIRNSMEINTTVLPDDSPWIPLCYNLSVEIVNYVLQCISPLIYDQCVYNLGGDNLVNYAQDVPGQTFFVTLRNTLKINNFVAGVISESHDETTGESLTVPDFFKTLTLANLQNLKTPWGRQYMAFAQSYGPNVWGLS
jgi:hypothetical protein